MLVDDECVLDFMRGWRKMFLRLLPVVFEGEGIFLSLKCQYFDDFDAISFGFLRNFWRNFGTFSSIFRGNKNFLIELSYIKTVFQYLLILVFKDKENLVSIEIKANC